MSDLLGHMASAFIGSALGGVFAFWIRAGDQARRVRELRAVCAGLHGRLEALEAERDTGGVENYLRAMDQAEREHRAQKGGGA